MAQTLISDPVWMGPQKFFPWVFTSTGSQCSKLLSYAISRKTNGPNLPVWPKF